ncbi:hypothetical protein [Exiguobacterium flavidum]|uniref:hypothetical protein n=1 Tax=Exiguobacterium flavidum TaxID=2184695 RepID=UPI000DF758AD|nr:hypothetical protein [Exiguobacterium flavidum]
MGNVQPKYLWMLIFILLLTNFATGAFAFYGALPKTDAPRVVQESIGGSLEDVMAKVGKTDITRADVYKKMKQEDAERTLDELIQAEVDRQTNDGKKPEVKRFD